MKILWERGEIAPMEQFLLFSTIFCYLLLDFNVKTGTRFSLRDKRLFEISEVEITSPLYVGQIQQSFARTYFDKFPCCKQTRFLFLCSTRDRMNQNRSLLFAALAFLHNKIHCRLLLQPILPIPSNQNFEEDYFLEKKNILNLSSAEFARRVRLSLVLLNPDTPCLCKQCK